MQCIIPEQNIVKQFNDELIRLRKAYDDANAATDVQISPELIVLLGIDSFPEVVRLDIEREQEAMRANQKKYANPPPKNPLMKKQMSLHKAEKYKDSGCSSKDVGTVETKSG